MNGDARLLRLPGMAGRLGVPAKWLREEAEAGRVPHLRAGEQLLFDPSAVERALRKRAAEFPSAEAGQLSLNVEGEDK